MATSDGNTPQSKIAQIIQKAAPAAKKPRKTTTKQALTPQPGVIYVAGSGNVVAGGDVTHHVHHHAPAPRPKVVIKTADGTIDATQRADLQALVREWMDTHKALKRRELTWGAAWGSFNKAMKVSGYAEIKPEQFDKAKAWLRRQIAILNSMASAPKKLPDLRVKRYAAIKTKCKNQLRDEFAYVPYIQKTFGKTSLTDLADQELERTYRYVMGKRAQTGSGSAQA
jgi:hypothetical protein